MTDIPSMEHQDPSDHESSIDVSPAKPLSIHDKLAKWMETAQKHPPGSTPRSLAITNMVREMNASGKITRWSRGQPIGDDILQDAWVSFVQRLDTYDPKKKATVLTWFNNILINRLRDSYRQTKRDRAKEQSTDQIEQTLSQINSSVMPHQSILEPFKYWLEEMPELEDIYISNRHDISVQKLIDYRILRRSDYPNWQSLGHLFDEKVKNLQNNWKRKCEPEMEFFLMFNKWFQPIAELSVSDSSEHTDIPPYHQKIIELRNISMDEHPDISAYRVLYHRYQYALKQDEHFRWSMLANFFKIDIAPLKTFWEQGCKPRLPFLDYDDVGRTL